MIPGKLYVSKKYIYHIWQDSTYSRHLGLLKEDEPFVCIEFIINNTKSSLTEDTRILTTDGIVGFIHTGDRNTNFFEEVME